MGEFEPDDEAIDAAITAKKDKKPPSEIPWPQMSEHLADLRVCEVMGKGASKLDARVLDLMEFYELLMLRSAQIEAEPVATKNQQAKADSDAKREEEAKKARGN